MNANATVDAVSTESSPRVSQGRIPQLDGLRGMAVLSVVLFHYTLSIPLPKDGLVGHAQDCFRLGEYGVDLFFVLSGFLIGGILLDSRESPRYFRTFYFRRFHRIFPLYYSWLALYVALGLTVFSHLPASIRADWTGWRPTVVYALFLQNLVSKQLWGISAAWLGPLWSLAVEEQFYLLTPLAVRFLPRRRLLQLLVVTIIVSPVLRIVVSAWQYPRTVRYVAMPLRADALAMGVLLALVLRDRAWQARIARNLRTLYGMILLLLTVIVSITVRNPVPENRTEGILVFLMGALFGAVVLLALVQPHGLWAGFCRLSALRFLGGVSYCIYVIHLAVNTFCQAFLHSVYAGRSISLDIAGVLLACVITWTLASVSWRFLESPAIRHGHTYKY
jgi:peptidoglycan/LPS O-acetylase OafA/YrhL